MLQKLFIFMINLLLIIRIQLANNHGPITKRTNLKTLKSQILMAENFRHLMRNFWIAKRNIKSSKQWSKRDGKPRSIKDSKHQQLFRQTLLKEFIKMLRNFNNLRNTRQKICNICNKMCKIESKVVSRGRGQITFRQIERLGILVPTPQVHM